MLQRIITALVAIPIAYLLVREGGWPFRGGLIVLGIVAWRELQLMARAKGYEVYYLSSLIPVVLSLLVAGTQWSGACLTLGLLAVLAQALYNHSRKAWDKEALLSAFALIYIGGLFPTFVAVRNFSGSALCGLSMGEALVWTILLGTWASDSFAYFAGRAWGKHKAIPAVSPKKSWEGYIAGFICANIVTVFAAERLLDFSLATALGLGLVVAIGAPIGDLVESQLKRYFEIKDSGNFFPGHGGVLDRLDSLLYVVPLSYYYCSFALK